MRILAIDTCFDAVSAAVGVRDERAEWRISERFEAIGKGHAEKVLPLVADVMSEARLSYRELDRIAVTNGPGGFTGLRAGLAAARGLALASGVPLVAIGSLELVALGMVRVRPIADAARPLVIAMDARKGDVFMQTFRSLAEPVATGAPVLAAIDVAAGLMPGRACTVAGSGAGPLVAASAAAGRRDVALAEVPSAKARDLVIAAAGLTPAGPVVPVYLRPPDAKPQAAAPIARSGL